jgi:hypothetical protein
MKKSACPYCRRPITAVRGRFAAHLNARKRICLGSGAWAHGEKYFRKTGKRT